MKKMDTQTAIKVASKQDLFIGSAFSNKNTEGFLTFLTIQVKLLTQCVQGTVEHENPLIRETLLLTANQTLLSIEQQGKFYLAKAISELNEGTDKIE